MSISIPSLKKPRKRLRTRNGMSSIEMAVVCCVILTFLIGTIFVLGESTRNALTGVASKISPDQADLYDSATSGSVGEANTVADSALSNTEVTFHLQLLVLMGAIVVSFLGVRYITFAKQKAKEEEPPECEVELLQRQTEALRKILGKRNSIYSHLREDWIQLFEGKAQIHPYMSTDVVTVRPNLPVDDCLAMLNQNGYRRVMVMHLDGRMAGVVSKKDLKSNDGDTVADVMTANPLTVEPDTCLGIALTKLIQHRISCLPVVKDGQLVGLLSTSDFMVVLQCVLLILNGQFGKTAHENDQVQVETLKDASQLEPQLTTP